jgi:hypothetical protein
MSNWNSYNIETKVRVILSEVEYHNPKHHFGRPFMTAYQLAIEFARRYPQEFVNLGYPIGGRGSGVQISLALYLARQLSARIKSVKITDIEGGFLSNLHLDNITFGNVGQKIESSLTKTNADLSMFRLLA